MSMRLTARATLMTAVFAVVTSACTSATPAPADSSTTTIPTAASTTATIAESTTTTATTATQRSSEDTVRHVVERLNEGDVATAMSAFAPDAVWDGFVGATRLDEPLPAEILPFAASLGLTAGATFADLWSANFDLFVGARTVWSIESCTTEGPTASCELEGVDAFTDLWDVAQHAVFEVSTDERGLVERFRFDVDWTGESSETADDFRRWAKLERPELDTEPAPIATRALVELLDRWESEGSPVVAPPDPGLDAVAVVRAYLAARNDQDWETHVRLLGGDALDNPFGSYDEFRATGALDRRIFAHDCTVTPLGDDSFVACTVDVTDIISAAAGRTPTNPNATTFAVRGGRIVDLPEFLPSLFLAEQAIEQWALANAPERYATACPSGIAGQDVITGFSCAAFIAEFREAWEAAVVGVY